jgi:hypothetical protein
MDIVDSAQDSIEAHLKKALATKQTVLGHTGKCLSCGEPFTEKRRYCDAECRDHHERSLLRAP